MRLKLHHQILIAMILGAGVGLPLNIYAGEKPLFSISAETAEQLDAGKLPQALLDGMTAHGRRKDGETGLSGRAAVETIQPGMRWMVADGNDRWMVRRRGQEVVVVTGGELPRTVAKYGKGLGDVFLRLLSMIVAPLIFTSLITGVTSTGNLEGLGRLGGRTILYYLSTSTIAIIVGVVIFNVVQPGARGDTALIQESAETVETGFIASEKGVGAILWEQVFTLIPANPFASLADPSNTSMLGVIFFALLFGVFITVTGGEAGRTLTNFFSGAFDVMMKMTLFIIRFAPLGVLGYMLYASAGKGLDVFKALGWYIVTVGLGLTVHSFLTVPLIQLLIARRSPWEYFKAMSPALLTAFSTASSNGTLPLTISCVEKRAGISNRISAFCLPLGATINMDGTALYEAVAVLFIGQVTGYDLSFGQQVIVAITALLASVGAAGIPHAGTVMMVVVLSSVNLPLEGVGLILAVDRILDMYRTAVNVWGDMTACAVMERLEREPPHPAAAGA